MYPVEDIEENEIYSIKDLASQFYNYCKKKKKKKRNLTCKSKNGQIKKKVKELLPFESKLHGDKKLTDLSVFVGRNPKVSSSVVFVLN